MSERDVNKDVQHAMVYVTAVGGRERNARMVAQGVWSKG